MKHISGQVLIDTDHFDEDCEALTGLGFVVDEIWPADAPSTVVVSGHGTTLRLVKTKRSTPITIMLVNEDPSEPSGVHHLPGGTRVIVEHAETGYRMPPGVPELAISTTDGDTGVGRAGMHYRDLLPNRWGGRFISSLISIPDGGPVPDYVHYHRVRFQLIFVKSGWVRVAYEDQGDPFVMHPGDAVLQVPEIRHRVLEASPGLEVVEITSPAEHITLADHDLELPNGVGDPGRRWDGQAFVHHVAAEAPYLAWDLAGWEARDTTIATATAGLASVRVARPKSDSLAADGSLVHHGEFRQLVVLSGAVSATVAGETTRLHGGAGVALPPDTTMVLSEPTTDCELLDVTLPAP